MKNLCFIIQGTTFLKSVFSLILLANNHGIRPVIFCIKTRAGKHYDDLSNKKDYIEDVIQKFAVDCDIVWCDNQQHALDYMLKNGLSAIVCQDAHHHGRQFCANANIKVFSIGVGFDILHHGNDIRLKKTTASIHPDVVYFPSKKIKDKFLELVKEYPSRVVAIGSPIFDHALFVEKTKKRDKKVVTFFVTLQNLVSKQLQQEIESFVIFCEKNDIIFNMKTKVKTPWNFSDKSLYSKVNVFESEDGFPATSIDLMLNSDVIISSYSTCSIEAEHFGIPCINLDSVDKKDLTYAVKSIKFDYDFENMYGSETCKTISDQLVNMYLMQVDKKKSPNENLTYENNSSQRILRDISSCL